MSVREQNAETEKAMRGKAAERAKKKQPCRDCKGDGLVMNIETGLFDECKKCGGSGMVAQP